MALNKLTRGLNQLSQAFGSRLGGGFSPASLSPFAWYPPGPAYMFTDAAKTTPISADGDLIYTWADASGNGRDLVQATSGARPVARFVNGSWIARTDGVSQFMQTAALTLNQPAVWGIRYKTQYISGSVPNNASLHSGTGDSMLLRTVNATNSLQVLSNTSLTTTLPLDFTNYGTLLTTFNGVSSEVRRNGSVFASGGAGATNAVRIVIGSLEGTLRFGKFDYAGLVVTSTTLTAQQKTDLENYLTLLAS